MAETIGELLQEHRNMAKLLDLLEAELAVYREGGVADFDLIRDIMDYTTSWPERYHHPKENLIFAKLKDKGAEAEALTVNLVA
jgi:hemerythrin-like domain-containing protein